MFDATHYPRLAAEGYDKTSCETWDYNCIAWAADDKQNWWWPPGGQYTIMGKLCYWPPKAPPQQTVKAFVLAFKTIGYEVCQNGDLESGYEKIAIYALNGKPEHAARQLPDGTWTHKMGPSIDLTTTLTAVEGPCYGAVVRFMRRRLKLRRKP